MIYDELAKEYTLVAYYSRCDLRKNPLNGMKVKNMYFFTNK